MNSQEADLPGTKQLKILANPIRQRILQVISAQGSISYTALKEELELTDGSLFYHLKNLNIYLKKDQQNFYQLNEEGKKVIDAIVHNVSIPQETKKETKWILDKIAFPDIFYYLLGDPIRSIVELNILLIVTAWLFGVSNNYFSSIEQIFSGGAIINGLISFLHWYLYLSLIFFALKALKIEFKVKELWVAIFTGLIPYSLYLIPAGIVYYTDSLQILWVLIVMKILFIICKIISTLYVIQGINLASTSKKYQAIVLASILVLVDYIYLMIVI
ncbi:MAG: winged helix-turn-helix domain-containing protein [Candidatus Heimdallarchaeaceae archaeon]